MVYKHRNPGKAYFVVLFSVECQMALMHSNVNPLGQERFIVRRQSQKITVYKWWFFWEGNIKGIDSQEQSPRNWHFVKNQTSIAAFTETSEINND